MNASTNTGVHTIRVIKMAFFSDAIARNQVRHKTKNVTSKFLPHPVATHLCRVLTM